MAFLFAFVTAWACFAGLGYYVAIQRGRPEVEGVALGALFGPLGVLVVLLLPVDPPTATGRSPARRRVEGWQPPDPREEEAEAEESRALRYLNEIQPKRPRQPQSGGFIDRMMGD